MDESVLIGWPSIGGRRVLGLSIVNSNVRAHHSKGIGYYPPKGRDFPNRSWHHTLSDSVSAKLPHDAHRNPRMILARSRTRRRSREDEAALGIDHRVPIYGPNEKSRVVVHRQPVLQLLVQSNVKTPTRTECPARVGKRVGIGNVPARE